MMFAASLGRADVIKVLTSRGADPNVVTNVSEVIKYDERVREKDRLEKEEKAREAALHPEKAKDQDKAKEVKKPKEEEEKESGSRKSAEKIFMGGMTALLFAAREGHIEAARQLLDRAGLDDVPVEEIGGQLTDHYDPTKRALFLSSANYEGRSLAAVGVAAHEAGHALQDQAGYAPLKFRMMLVPEIGRAHV